MQSFLHGRLLCALFPLHTSASAQSVPSRQGRPSFNLPSRPAARAAERSPSGVAPAAEAGTDVAPRSDPPTVPVIRKKGAAGVGSAVSGVPSAKRASCSGPRPPHGLGSSLISILRLAFVQRRNDSAEGEVVLLHRNSSPTRAAKGCARGVLSWRSFHLPAATQHLAAALRGAPAGQRAASDASSWSS